MHLLQQAVLTLSLVAPLFAQDPGAARVDRQDIVQHYTNVESELRAAPLPADAALAKRRTRVLDLLRDYRTLADFGRTQTPTGSRIPQFIDSAGRRCAVAYLLDHTGQAELSLAVSRRCNEAWVVELVEDPALIAWFAANGISAAEAARIQAPGPEPRPLPPRERPTPPVWEPNDGDTRAAGAGNGTSGPARTGSRPQSNPNPAVAGRSAGGSMPRGTSIADLEATSWTAWWNWNQEPLSLPAGLRAHRTDTGTAALDPQRLAAERLLTGLLRSTNATERRAATQALGRIGAAPGVLEALLDDPEREVRLTALLSLGSAGTPAQIHQLITRLASGKDAEQRSVAIAALAAPRTGAVGRLVDGVVQGAFAPGESFDVLAASAIVGSAGPSADLRELALDRLQRGDSPLVRAIAAELLGTSADREQIAALTRAVSERSVDVRRSAALALGRSRFDLALPALQTAFELEHDQWTRAFILLAIGDHGGGNASDFLEQQMVSGSKPLRAFAALGLGLAGRGAPANRSKAIAEAYGNDRNRDQQGAYLIALGMLRDDGSRNLLAKALRSASTSQTRMAAANALGMIGEPVDREVLERALRDDHCPAVREQSAYALAAFGDSAVDALSDALRSDASEPARNAAAWALGGTGSDRAGRLLLAAAGDQDAAPTVRAGAVQGLGRHFRNRAPHLPGLRFQHNFTLLPNVLAWALCQEI